MLFHTPGMYLDPAREYYEKHGFNYSYGRNAGYGLFPLDSLLAGPEGAPLLKKDIVPNLDTGLEAITKSYATGDSFVMGLISDKTRFARAAVTGLARQIQEREHIKEQNIERLDYDSCLCGTHLHELMVWGDHQLVAKRRQTLDMVLFGLNRERRAEEVSCWRDISLLKKDFVKELAAYAAAARREGLFMGTSYLDGSANRGEKG